MLLTLSAKSICATDGSQRKAVRLLDLPSIARRDLGFSGLTLQTSLLSGWEAPQLDRLRDDADKAGAPCLLLVEEQPQPFADPSPEVMATAADRAGRVMRAAHRLGCSSVAFSVSNPPVDVPVEVIAQRLKDVLSAAERMELNLLLAPGAGPTQLPERLTMLIRKVGGFRIGSYPDFQAAAETADPVGYLRSLTPYASAVCAGIGEFDETTGMTKPGSKAYDLGVCLDAVLSVGFEATLTLEYRGKKDALEPLSAAKKWIDSKLTDAPPAEEAES